MDLEPYVNRPLYLNLAIKKQKRKKTKFRFMKTLLFSYVKKNLKIQKLPATKLKSKKVAHKLNYPRRNLETMKYPMNMKLMLAASSLSQP